jgi:hypothetical protein
LKHANQMHGSSHLWFVKFWFIKVQSECQLLICDILRATPDATSADAAAQTARLASKALPANAK